MSDANELLSNIDLSNVVDQVDLPAYPISLEVTDTDLIATKSDSSAVNLGNFKEIAGDEIRDVVLSSSGHLISTQLVAGDRDVGPAIVYKEDAYEISGLGLLSGVSQIPHPDPYGEFNYAIPATPEFTLEEQDNVVLTNGITVSAPNVSSNLTYTVAKLLNRTVVDTTDGFMWDVGDTSSKYIDVTFPESVELAGIRLQNLRSDRAILDGQLEVSNDGGVSWAIVHVFDLTSALLQPYDVIFPTVVTTSILRLRALTYVSQGSLGRLEPLIKINDKNYLLEYKNLSINADSFNVVEDGTTITLSLNGSSGGGGAVPEYLNYNKYLKIKSVLPPTQTIAGKAGFALPLVITDIVENTLQATVVDPVIVVGKGKYVVEIKLSSSQYSSSQIYLCDAKTGVPLDYSHAANSTTTRDTVDVQKFSFDLNMYEDGGFCIHLLPTSAQTLVTASYAGEPFLEVEVWQVSEEIIDATDEYPDFLFPAPWYDDFSTVIPTATANLSAELSITSSSVLSATFEPWNAFDYTAFVNHWISAELPTSVTPQWIEVEFLLGTVNIAGYAVVNPSVDGKTTPKSWRLLGRNDIADGWTTIHQVSDSFSQLGSAIRPNRLKQPFEFSIFRLEIVDHNLGTDSGVAVGGIAFFDAALDLVAPVKRAEASVVLSNLNAGNGAHFFDGVTRDHSPNGTAIYFSSSNHYAIIHSKQPFRLWRQGSDSYPARSASLSISCLSGEDLMYDLSTPAPINVGSGTWVRITEVLPAGAYKFSYTGLRIDTQWFVEDATDLPAYVHPRKRQSKIVAMSANLTTTQIANASSRLSATYQPFDAFSAITPPPTGSRWISNSKATPSSPQWLSLSFRVEPVIINKYGIYNRVDSTAANTMSPKSWVFQGKTLAGNWVTLHEVVDDVRNDIGLYREFDFINDVAYDSYRLYITDTNDGGQNYTVVAGLLMFHVE